MLGFTPTVRTTGPVDTAVPARVREQLLAVLREAVSNIARHALADQAEVELPRRPDEVRARVIDDGIGLADGARRERAAQRPPAGSDDGGTLELVGEPRGTLVRLAGLARPEPRTWRGPPPDGGWPRRSASGSGLA